MTEKLLTEKEEDFTYRVFLLVRNVELLMAHRKYREQLKRQRKLSETSLMQRASNLSSPTTTWHRINHTTGHVLARLRKRQSRRGGLLTPDETIDSLDSVPLSELPHSPLNASPIHPEKQAPLIRPCRNLRPLERQNIKRGLTECYRGLELLKNYRILNYTGFVKILKKYDKVRSLTLTLFLMCCAET